MLMAAAAASQNSDLKKAVAAFTGLTPATRKALVGSIEVFDRAPLITELDILIEERLRMIAPRGKAAIAREHLKAGGGPAYARPCKLMRPALSRSSRLSKSLTIYAIA